MTAPAVRHPGEFRWETRLLAVVTLALTAMGIAACYSSATYLNNWYREASQQASAALAGGVIFLIACYADYQIWRRVGRFLFYATVAALVVIAIAAQLWPKKNSAPAIVETFFPSTNGARRWIKLGFQIQVSEIARFALAVWLAIRATELGAKIRDFRDGFLPLLLTVGAVAVLVAMEPSVSMAVVLTVIGITVIFTAGARIEHLLLPVFAGAAALAGILLFDPVRAKRMADFLGSGLTCGTDQACESLIGFGNGGLFGLGFGRGTQKLGHLPESYSDFLFSVIGEEWGFVGVVFVVLCFTLFCWMGFRIARTARDPFGTFLAAGLTIAVAITGLMHAAVVMRLMPTTGLTLPFMSAGRVSLVLYLFSAGVIVSIGRRRGRPARER